MAGFVAGFGFVGGVVVSFTGFGFICFKRAWVAGNGLMRLPPGVTGRSGSSSPSRIWTYSENVRYRMEVSIRRIMENAAGHGSDQRRRAASSCWAITGSIVEGVPEFPVCHIVGGICFQPSVAVVSA